MATIDILSTIDLPENPATNDVIATLRVIGGREGETFIYELGELSAYFGIDGDLLYVKDGALLDYESLIEKVFNLSITATSEALEDPTIVDPAEVVVNVTNVNEAPTDIIVAGGKVVENAYVDTVVATLTGVDPDMGSEFTYSIVADADGNEPSTPNPYFMIHPESNEIVLKSALNDAQIGTHKLWIKVTDNGDPSLSYVKQVTITVTDFVETTNGTRKNDKLTGTIGADVINGNDGNDYIRGLAGDDVLNGGDDKDKIYGSDGNDTINGGADKDMLYGGDGRDVFVFNTAVKKGGDFDHIREFVASDDTIQISLAALKSLKVKGPKKSDVHSKKGSDDEKGKPDKGRSDDKKSVGFDKIFKKGKKLESKFFDIGTKTNDAPDDSNDYIFYNKKNGKVYVDVDGAGKGKGIEIFKVDPGTKLSASDFLFI